MPFTGKLMTINQALAKQPGLINGDPYGAGWIVKMEPGSSDDVDALMDAAAYEASLAE
jgi:glycine cleavage system H protein